MNKVTQMFNQLISKAEIKALTKAADILTRSDKHDALFFELCKSHMKAEPTADVVAIGSDFAFVRTHVVAKDQTAKIEVLR